MGAPGDSTLGCPPPGSFGRVVEARPVEHFYWLLARSGVLRHLILKLKEAAHALLASSGEKPVKEVRAPEECKAEMGSDPWLAVAALPVEVERSE
ncbi:hypothetical protein NDU88_004729 [Pleurodeles waltl]|uniref:Uncharacterized protein n=1 Tax=Pleurodeles waltl TaxID=8319 RepID=A0AAV7L7J2_PLEWA|nr:hypothetical protein NDU88_004729 [Pleurodeles waltl]